MVLKTIGYLPPVITHLFSLKSPLSVLCKFLWRTLICARRAHPRAHTSLSQSEMRGLVLTSISYSYYHDIVQRSDRHKKKDRCLETWLAWCLALIPQ